MIGGTYDVTYFLTFEKQSFQEISPQICNVRRLPESFVCWPPGFAVLTPYSACHGVELCFLILAIMYLGKRDARKYNEHMQIYDTVPEKVTQGRRT